nr:reverse transcriptase domain-containing protein [Tanacetum cinerariifolium]
MEMVEIEMEVTMWGVPIRNSWRSAILKAGALTNEAVRCGKLSKSVEKRKETKGLSKQRGSWFDNKKVNVGKGFVANGTVKGRACQLCYKFQKQPTIVRPSLNEANMLQRPVTKVSVRCQKPGHLAARLGCDETTVATWDYLAFKLIILG